MKKSYIYAITTVLIWSTMAAIVKKMLYDIPSLEALSVSSVFSFLFLLLVNVKNGMIREMKHYSVKEYGIMSGLGLLDYLCILRCIIMELPILAPRRHVF